MSPIERKKPPVPPPGEYFRAAGRVFRRANSGLEEDFGGVVGRSIRATEYEINNGDDFMRAIDQEWVPLAAIAYVYDDEKEAERWLQGKNRVTCRDSGRGLTGPLKPGGSV